ncbi:MAG TPA: hypothetical protein VFG03_04545 [Telluria sp.]|nr:hypothetical protein [Telluria sp.]
MCHRLNVAVQDRRAQQHAERAPELGVVEVVLALELLLDLLLARQKLIVINTTSKLAVQLSRTVAMGRVRIAVLSHSRRKKTNASALVRGVIRLSAPCRGAAG